MRFRIAIVSLLIFSFPAMAQVTFTITSTPEKKPAKDSIYLAAPFNGWSPCAPGYSFKPNSQGTLTLTLKQVPDTFEYKLSRGSWKNVEVDGSGRDIPNRSYTSSMGPEVALTVLGWRDGFTSKVKVSTASKNVSFMSSNIEIPGLNRRRTVRMYFPPNYSTGGRFPVIYMHDGQNLFDNSTAFAGEWNVDETLDSLYTYQGFSCIVVGIYNGDSERINEYSPWRHDSLGLGGDGDKYARFIVRTLKPFIDSHYKTLPDRENTAIMGSSMGGLISLYMALEFPDIFGKVGVFSPSLWFSPKIFEMMQKYKLKKPQKLYLLAGAKEGGSTVPDLEKAMELLVKAGFDDQYYIRMKIDPNGRHNESFWAREFGNAVRYLFNF